MTKIIGIYFGTSNLASDMMRGDSLIITSSSKGITAPEGKVFPFGVAFTKEGRLLVGEPTRRQIVNPENTITTFERKINSDHIYKISGKEYKPQQISVCLLQKTKKDINDFFGKKSRRWL